MRSAIERAAAAVASADAFLIGAGAGMSVDSGIPAFRLNPPAAPGEPELPKLSSGGPMLFSINPKVAWGKAGARLIAFRRARPHRGYEILRRWAQRPGVDAFVVTSNVDGLFLDAGFEPRRVLEGHGSMRYLQCIEPCTPDVWSAEGYQPDLDAREVAHEPLPTCPRCRRVARPNVFMFGDLAFSPTRANEQLAAFDAWCAALSGRRLAVVECGAGTAVPTIRTKCQALAREHDAPHVRINVGESHGPRGTIALSLGAREALERIDEQLAD